jgi:DNA-binding transcriptional LysR family regulator
MDLQHLTTFRTIAILGSFSQAADVLGYAQSTVSEHIRLLEADLQSRLFKRSGNKKVVLTPEGERLLTYAQKMSNLEIQIKAEVNHPEEPRGSLSIRIPETVSQYYLSTMFARYHTRFPGINLSLMDCMFFDLPEELKAGVVDLGFLIIDRYVVKDLATETLLPVPLVLVTYPRHPLAGDPDVDLSRLKDGPLLVPSNDCSYSHLLERVLVEQKVNIPRVWRFNSIAAIKKVLISGVGFAVLPEIAVRDEVAAGMLTILPWNGQETVTARLIMAWQQNKWLVPALKAFMDMAREELAK